MLAIDFDDTIAAIASAPGVAARGIVRLSGPRAMKCALARFRTTTDPVGSKCGPFLQTGQIVLAGFASPLPVDAYVWPNVRSFTRQPSAELHTIGSPPLLAALLETVFAAGARQARPGEFTMRAFLAGRLDLAQAEAVLAAIDADNDASLQAALEQLAGGLSRPIDVLRGQLLDLLAHLEAGLDFADEDIELITQHELRTSLEAARDSATQVLAKLRRRDALDRNYRIALIGAPNAGKSSLFNALASQGRAIVSPTPGSTRDVLTAPVELNGLEAVLLDTAGIDASWVDELGRDSQAHSHAARVRADVRLLCLDGARNLSPWEQQEVARTDPRRVVAITKCDLERTISAVAGIRVSSRTGEGVDRVKTALRAALTTAQDVTPGELAADTSQRCGESLLRARLCLEEAVQLAAGRAEHELIAAELRIALDELGQIVGAVYTDDVLDRVFSRFCIGK